MQSVGVLWLAATLVAAAHDARAQGRSACATANTPTADSLTLLLTSVVEPFDVGENGASEYATRIAGEIVGALAVPTPFGMDAYVGHRMPADDAQHITGAHLDLDAMYGITLTRDGHVKHAGVITTSLNPALDRAVLAAIRQVDSAGSFAPVPGRTQGDTLPLRLLLTASDSSRARGVPILRARVPLRHLDRQLAPAGDERAPQYPDELRGRGIPGRVDVSFVVDAKGALIRSTISVRGATDAAFARSVLEVLPSYRFIPAAVDGCAVPFHGAMPFVFAGR